ncbi:hypothetical protein LUX57_17395 [Actinomadura madurae]|uniref:hypothetical protein n=1 Tax=Actinomadura madurae TaxID=1993 RepID=UPI0020D23B52|nr:hypothetical protein [Actinomadura madurae]MCP9966659.1 hypothetical protein [Actinomadura madurae]
MRRAPPARRAASSSWSSSGPPAAASPVANPPRTTSGVTHAGSPATGVLDPMSSEPSFIPETTRSQRPRRSSARRRVAASSWASAVTSALAICPAA